MSSYQPPEAPEIRNPLTAARHRREVFWQITMPMLGGLLVLLLLVLAIGLAGVGDVRTWADISMIWLIIPLLIASVILLAILVVMVYGITRLLAVLPAFTFRAQIFTVRVRNAVRMNADKAVEPFLRVRSAAAAVKVLGKR